MKLLTDHLGLVRVIKLIKTYIHQLHLIQTLYIIWDIMIHKMIFGDQLLGYVELINMKKN
jgi:hypothetical protein